MPVRQASPTPGPTRRPAAAPAPPTRQQAAPPRRQAPHQELSEEDQVWEDIMNSKEQGGGEGGFDKRNTNFYLMDGDANVRVIITNNIPFVFTGHNIKCETQNGKTFYVTEACQRSVQDHCVLCEARHSGIGKPKKSIIFTIVSERGSFDKRLNNNAGGWDMNPKGMLYNAPQYVAKLLGSMRSEADGDLTDKIIKLGKTGANTQAGFVTHKITGGQAFTEAPDVSQIPLPDASIVFAVQDDDTLLQFLEENIAGGMRGNMATAQQPAVSGGGGFQQPAPQRQATGSGFGGGAPQRQAPQRQAPQQGGGGFGTAGRQQPPQRQGFQRQAPQRQPTYDNTDELPDDLPF